MTVRPSGQGPRLTLVINSLGGGGAERVLSTMANWWADHGVSVTLITLAGTGSDFYPLSPAVRRVALDLSRPSSGLLDALRANAARVAGLRRALRNSRPDAVISFCDITNVLVLAAGTGMRVPVIVSERIDPRRYPIGRFWSALRRLVYRRAAALVVQTEALRPWAETHTAPGRVAVIPNPVRVEAATAECQIDAATRQAPEHRIVAMGRLDPQKGFDVLLRAFARCALQAPDWTLTILGEGPERPALECMISELGLAGRVTLPGRVSDPAARLRAADLFVLSSRFEGFPNALVEAMACGLPVLSTDCPTGPAEIIRPGVDGVLVPPDDEEALARALLYLIENPDERRRLAARAPEVAERFSLERVMAMWDQVVKRTI